MLNRFINSCHRQYFGFTLAEVLIVLGVIGIVAAITIPSLISESQDQVLVTRLKKNFTAISQAYLTAVANEGAIEDWGPHPATLDDATKKQWIETFTKYLNIQKDCTNTDSGCLPYTGYKYLLDNGTFYTGLNTGTAFYKYLLADGSSLIISVNNGMDAANNYYLSQLIFYVDVNGLAPPNIISWDLFGPIYATTQKGVYAFGRSTTGTLAQAGPYGCRNTVSNFMFNTGCTLWVLYYENIDYKYVNNLEWNVVTHK